MPPASITTTFLTAETTVPIAAQAKAGGACGIGGRMRAALGLPAEQADRVFEGMSIVGERDAR